MIQVTLTVTAAQLAQIASIMDPEVHTTETSSKTRTAPPKDDAKKVEKKETKAAEPEVQGKNAEGGAVDEAPSADDVMAAAKMFSAKNGREALVALLEKHGAKNVSGVPEAKRQAFIDEASA